MKDKESIIGEYKYWEPEGVTIPKLIYELKSFLWDWEKVKIIYDDMEGTQVEITFDIERVFYYCRANESYRLRTIEELNCRIKSNNDEFMFIFELRNSELKKWFYKETYEKYSDDYNIRHFIFIASNDVVDVLASREPEVMVKTYKSE